MLRAGVTAVSSRLTFLADKRAHVKRYAVQRCRIICSLRVQAHHRTPKFPFSVYHLFDLEPCSNWKIAVHSKAK